METKKNKRQFHGICHLQMFKKNSQSQSQIDEDKILLKYFPKHIDKFPSYFLMNGNLQTRIKHLKLIRRIPEDDHKECCDGDWRQMVLIKRKTIKVFPHVYHLEGSQGYSKQSVQLLKMLPNVQNVEFCLEPHPEWEYEYLEDEEDEEYKEVNDLPKQMYWQKKMSEYLPSMGCLKYLKLSNRCFHLLPLFSKLNSFETMLKNLDVLQVFISFSGPQGYFDFQDLLGYKTVFKYVTHLKLEMPGEMESFEVFQLLPHSCPRLSFLSLEPKYPDLEDYSSLECFHAFQSLQRLKLHIHGKLKIFTQRKLPSSLRHLDLCFDNIKWKKFIVSINQQEGLQNLEKLHLNFEIYDPQKDFALIKNFIQALLKKILTLKEFNMKLCPKYLEGHQYWFDISQFLELLGHHNQSLETLIIDADIRYKFFNLESNTVHFPKLSYLSLSGKEIPSQNGTQNALRNIIELVQAKSEQSPSCVNLHRVNPLSLRGSDFIFLKF